MRNSLELSGIGIVSDAFCESEMDDLESAFAVSTLPRTKAGIRHVLRDPAVADLANDQRLISIAKEILGEHAFPFRATLFDKSPDSNWLVVWHQDTALPITERRDLPGWGPWSIKAGINYAHAPASALEQVLAIRIHLDDSTSHNGPLRILPGTHNRGVLTDDEIHELASAVTPVECTVPRGGLVLMRPLIVHASSKSVLDSPSRRVLHIEYAGSRSLGGLHLEFS